MEYDPHKNAENIRKHGIPFSAAEYFIWESAITAVDDRYDYGETRYISYGFIGQRLHILIWTERNNQNRIISLRKANARERKQYAKGTESSGYSTDR